MKLPQRHGDTEQFELPTAHVPGGFLLSIGLCVSAPLWPSY